MLSTHPTRAAVISYRANIKTTSQGRYVQHMIGGEPNKRAKVSTKEVPKGYQSLLYIYSREYQGVKLGLDPSTLKGIDNYDYKLTTVLTDHTR